VHPQTYGYLSSLKASPTIGWYQIAANKRSDNTLNVSQLLSPFMLTATFQGKPVAECTHSFWILLEPRMMKVAVTAGAIRRHHQQTNTQLFAGQMPFLSPNQMSKH